MQMFEKDGAASMVTLRGRRPPNENTVAKTGAVPTVTGWK